MAKEDKKLSILIVDDDRFLINMYSVKFRAAGFVVHIAFDGPDTIEKLKSGLNPDILMLDMVMPGMTGLEVLAKIRAEKLAPHTRIVALSNQNQPSDIEAAKAFHIQGYIVKASSIPSEVVAEIKKILTLPL